MKTILVLLLNVSSVGCVSLSFSHADNFNRAVLDSLEVSASCSTVAIDVHGDGSLSICDSKVFGRDLRQIANVPNIPVRPLNVIIRVGWGAPHKEVMSVYNEIKRSGISNVDFSSAALGSHIGKAQRDQPAATNIFERGILNTSTAQYYVVFENTDDVSNSEELQCVFGETLVFAICIEEHIPVDDYGLWRGRQIAIKNESRRFKFSDLAAKKILYQHWNEKTYQSVADLLKKLETRELKALVEDRSSWLCQLYHQHKNRFECQAAIAAVLTQRGVLCGCSCETSDIYLPGE